MSMRLKRPVSLAALFAAALALQACDGGNSLTNSFAGGYDAGFRKSFASSFTDSCVKGTIEQKVPADKAQSLCKCASDDLLQKYNVQQLTNLTPEQTTEVAKACAKKLGYTK